MGVTHLNRAGTAADLSEQFLYFRAKETDGIPERSGTFVRVGMGVMQEDGICTEAIWPYNPQEIAGNEGQGPPPNGADADALAHRILGTTALAPRSSEELRGSLDAGFPIALSIPVYVNWTKNPTANATGLIPMPLPNSILDGGHAMCAIGYGYDDGFAGGGFFILRNSWGPGWAPLSPTGPGHGLLPFLYMDKFGWEAFRVQGEAEQA